MVIYSGVVLIAGSLNILYTLIITWGFFTVQYYLIIELEENTLINIFGKEYEKYINNVPKLFPRFSSWKNKDKYVPMKFYKTIKTEKRTLQNILLLVLIIFFKHYLV